MSLLEKIRSFYRPLKIIAGILAIATGYLLGDGTLSWSWWYLGAIPLIIGLTNYCPLCSLINKCDIGSKK